MIIEQSDLPNSCGHSKVVDEYGDEGACVVVDVGGARVPHDEWG
jgi:hypothetical protein